MRRLNKVDFKFLNELDTVNKRKSYIQDLIIKEFVKIKQGVLIAFTSFGKGFLMYKLIYLFNKEKPNSTILIIVPRIDLQNDINKDLKRYGFKNVTVQVVNTLANQLVKKNTTAYYDLVLADELHNLCGENSLYFSEIISHLNYEYFLGCSATLENSHLEYLKQKDLEVFFNISLDDGFSANLVPEYIIYNIPVQFEENEKKQYVKLQDEYQQIISKFSQHDENNPVGCITACLSPKNIKIKYNGVVKYSVEHAEDIAESLDLNKGQVIGLALKWRTCMVQRKSVLINAKQSLIATVQILNRINDQVLVFCSSIEIANFFAKNIKNSAAYHSKISSKTREKNKQEFTDEKLKYLFVCNSMKEGYNNNKLKYIIRQGFTSKSLDLTQILGRGLRFDETNKLKYTTLIHPYVDDFYVGEKLYSSQQKKWLQKALKGKSFIEWVEIKDLKL